MTQCDYNEPCLNEQMAIAKNKNLIIGLREDVNDLNDKRVISEGQIESNTNNIATNITNIATNTANISTNSSSINDNRADIDNNTSNITSLQANSVFILYLSTNSGNLTQEQLESLSLHKNNSKIVINDICYYWIQEDSAYIFFTASRANVPADNQGKMYSLIINKGGRIYDTTDIVLATEEDIRLLNERIDNIKNAQILNKGVITSTVANIQNVCTQYVVDNYGRQPKYLDALIVTMTDKNNDKVLWIYSSFSNIWINSGINGVDLSNYYTKEQVDNKVNVKANANDVYSKSDVNNTFVNQSEMVHYAKVSANNLNADNVTAWQNKLNFGAKADKSDLDNTNTQVSNNSTAIGQIQTNKANTDASNIDVQKYKDKLSIPVGVSLYPDTGQNTDGSMTQKAVTDNINGIINNTTIIKDAKGGFSAGEGATTNLGGGAIGKNAIASHGGGAVGVNTGTLGGGAIGKNAYCTGGGAVGTFAYSEVGGAVGENAKAGLGFSGGWKAEVKKLGTPEVPNYIDAVQVGTGTNEIPMSFQVYTDNLWKADTHELGKIVADAIFPIGTVRLFNDATDHSSDYGLTWVKIGSDRALWLDSENHTPGTLIEAGLPNITGTLGKLAGISYQGTGAFTTSGVGDTYGRGGTASTGMINASFDAKRLSPLYGASNTVQPKAYVVSAWVRDS